MALVKIHDVSLDVFFSAWALKLAFNLATIVEIHIPILRPFHCSFPPLRGCFFLETLGDDDDDDFI